MTVSLASATTSKRCRPRLAISRSSTGRRLTRNNIAPRVGVTYDLSGGKSVIRAAYGRFTSAEHLELIAVCGIRCSRPRRRRPSR
jgi:hypothetical protein